MTAKSKSETYHVYQNAANKQGWTGRTALNTDHIDKPMKWETPRMIFVCSMGDLFHENVPFRWLDWVFSVMSDNDQHIYVLLTKRPGNMLKYWQYKCAEHNIFWRPKDNVWIGVTAENQEQANKRIPILLQIPAAKRFVSIEPMLGPVDLKHGFDYGDEIAIDFLTGDYFTSPRQEEPAHDDNKIDWVICGGESGPKARPMHPDWVRSLRDQCKYAGVPFFFKQWGEWFSADVDLFIIQQNRSVKKNFCTLSKDGACIMNPNTSLIDQAPNYKKGNFGLWKIGRKAAGNILDGQQHHNWPITIPQ